MRALDDSRMTTFANFRAYDFPARDSPSHDLAGPLRETFPLRWHLAPSTTTLAISGTSALQIGTTPRSGSRPIRIGMVRLPATHVFTAFAVRVILKLDVH